MSKVVVSFFERRMTNIVILTVVLMTAAVSQAVVTLRSSKVNLNCQGQYCNFLTGPQCADPCVCYIIRNPSGVCKLVG